MAADNGMNCLLQKAREFQFNQEVQERYRGCTNSQRIKKLFRAHLLIDCTNFYIKKQFQKIIITCDPVKKGYMLTHYSFCAINAFTVAVRWESPLHNTANLDFAL